MTGGLRGGVAACALLAAALACAGEAPEAPAELPGSLPESLSTSLARSSPASLPSSFLREKPAYVDRIIAGTKPQADRATGDSDGDPAPDGPPRFFSAELIASTIRANSANDDGLGSITRQRQNFSETGLVVTGEIDTASYGQLRLDGVAGLVHRAFQGSISQRGLNFDGGWRADNVVGTLLPRRIDLGASQGRFVVPVTPLLGAASSWVRTSPDQSEPDDSGNLALNVAVGEPGTLTGIRVDGYHGLGGMSFGGGIQSALGGNWQFGVQTLVQRNVGDRYAAFATPDAPRSRLDDAAVFGILAWQADTLHVQGGIIHSSVTSRGAVEATTTSGVFGADAAAANGIFVDASDRFGRFTISGGGYRFDPGPSWGQDRLDDDAYGLYARGSYRSPRWQLNAGLDASRSITGLRDSETTLTAGGRYRISRDRAAGANLVLRSAGGQNGFDIEA